MIVVRWVGVLEGCDGGSGNVCLHRDKPGGRLGDDPCDLVSQVKEVEQRRKAPPQPQRLPPPGQARWAADPCDLVSQVKEVEQRRKAPPQAQRLPPPTQGRWAAWGRSQTVGVHVARA